MREIEGKINERKKFPGDPVFQIEGDPRWYFFDESWAYHEGPFDSEDKCDEALREYGRQL